MTVTRTNTGGGSRLHVSVPLLTEFDSRPFYSPRKISCSAFFRVLGSDAMTAWRMAFRDGTNGPSLWDDCRQLSVAALEYGPVDNIDLSKYPKGEPKQAWSQLKPTQRTSLRR